MVKKFTLKQLLKNEVEVFHFLVKHQIKSTFRYLLKIEHLQPDLQSILTFVRRTPKIKESELRNEFIQLNRELKTIEQTQFERKPFLYLDIISWLDSKIENVSVGGIIKRKMQTARLQTST